MEEILESNARFFALAQRYDVECLVMEDKYEPDIALF